MQNKPRVFAVSHHSPLDIVSLFPDNLSVTYDPGTEADVLICNRMPEGEVKVETVFLFSSNPPEEMTVLDETKPGEVRSITVKVIDQVFSKVTIMKVKPKTKIKKKVQTSRRPIKRNNKVIKSVKKPKTKTTPKKKPVRPKKKKAKR